MKNIKKFESLPKVDLTKIVRNSIEPVNEAFVAQEKPVKQISERVSQATKESHKELYGLHVKAFNTTSIELDSVSRDNANPRHCEFSSLKSDESRELNSVWLHELFFANCFDPHSDITVDSLPFMRLERDFGSFTAWQKDFMACALSAVPGWVVTGYNMYLRKYVNTIIRGNDVGMMLGIYPVIVLDCWEHAFSRDRGNDVSSHVVIHMKEFNWRVIEERFKIADNVAQSLKSGD